MSDDDIENDFPFELEAFLNTMARMLTRNFETREISVLASSKAELLLEDFDRWNGGQYVWAMVLSLPPQVVSQVGDEISSVEDRLRSLAESILAGYDNHHIARISLAPEVILNPRWRENAKNWVAGGHANNQGRVRSDNIAAKQKDGLLFRSEPEIYLYEALKSLGISFAPLPVFVRGGREYQRIEPDFIAIKSGVMMLIEIDGDSFHHETPAEAHKRTRMLIEEGVRHERVRAEECDTLQKARAQAERIHRLIKKYASER